MVVDRGLEVAKLVVGDIVVRERLTDGGVIDMNLPLGAVGRIVEADFVGDAGGGAMLGRVLCLTGSTRGKTATGVVKATLRRLDSPGEIAFYLVTGV